MTIGYTWFSQSVRGSACNPESKLLLLGEISALDPADLAIRRLADVRRRRSVTRHTFAASGLGLTTGCTIPHHAIGDIVSASDKAEEYKGKAKEATGNVTDNDDLKSEGKSDQASSSVKQTVDDAAGKAKDVTQSAKEKLTGN